MNQIGTIYRRPWGTYRTIEIGENYQVKLITVDPGKRLSLQSHQHRSEHWTIIKGTGEVTLGKDKILVSLNSSVYIPKTVLHRAHNTGTEELHFIEVQVGEYLGEDDITRYEDDFGRVE